MEFISQIDTDRQANWQSYTQTRTAYNRFNTYTRSKGAHSASFKLNKRFQAYICHAFYH